MTKPSSLTSSQTDPFGRKYKIISKIGEGSYSEVLKCKNRENGSVLACKRLKHCYRSWNQVNDIPEIVTLRKLARHPNILQMAEIHFDPKVGRVSLVFELMDMNLYELIKDRKRLLPEPRVRVMMFQLIRALRHLHKHGIFHRDVKPENILLKNDLLKLGDLGSVRGLYSQPPYTEYISTRWYRSPECLLTCGYYSFKMDVWAAGCVFYEILTLRPLFPGSSELDQINRVHNVLGPPPQKILQKFDSHAGIERDYSRHTSKQARLDTMYAKKLLSELKNSNFDWYFTRKEPQGVDTLLPTHVTTEAKDLLKHLLHYDPDSRPSSHRALQHAYFKDLREQAQRAAKGKLSSVTGPIVTIVGDEGGIEVLADDNANPVDLAKLGDEKLKYKQQQKGASEQKESVTLSERQPRKSTIFSKDSTMKLQCSVLKKTGHILNEAGESFAGETNQEEIEIKKPTSTMKPNSQEDRAKFVARRLANLQKFGNDAMVSNLPFQKIYLAGDADEGDGLNIHPADFSTLQSDESKQKKYHSTNNNDSKNSTTINQSRRRESSKTKLNVERKKSKTLLSNETSSSRGFPLEFIDKTSLTPDAITRINENRRIAHMQPIENLDLNYKNHPNNNVNSSTYSQSTTSGKDTHYISKTNTVHDLKQLRQPRSPLPMSPNEFSPRTYHHQLKHGQKPMKLDHNHVVTNLRGSPSAADYTPNRNDNSPYSGNSLSSSKYVNRNHSTHANNTNKQVKELLAAFPLKRNIIEDGKIVNSDKAKNEHVQAHILDGQSDRSSYKIAEIKQAYSKNQLVENLGALRKKYEAESKGIYQSQTLCGRSDGGNNKNFNLEKNNSSNVNPKNSIDNYAKTTAHISKLIKIKQNPKINAREGLHDRNFIHDNDHRNHAEHKTKDSSIYDTSLHQNPTSNGTRKTHIDIKDFGKDSFNRRELSLNKDTNASCNYSDHHEKDKALRLSDFNKVPNRDHHERGRDGVYEYGKPFSDRALRYRDHHHNPDQHHRHHNTIISEIKIQNHERSLDLSPIEQKNVVDSTTSTSPNKIRRVIEHQRKAQLVTTDTEADCDNLNLKSRKIDSLRRRQRSKNATYSNPNTSRTTQNHQQLLINTNSLSDYPPRIKQQPFQVLPQPASDTNHNYHSSVSRLGAAATIYSNQVTTNKQVREILAEMRKRRDVLEEKFTEDTIDRRWDKSPRAEDNKIKSKYSESVLKRHTEIPRKDEFRESHYSNKANNNTTNYHGVTLSRAKHSGIQGQAATVAELSSFKCREQKYSNRQSEDLNYSKSKAKLGHQASGSLKCPESESKIKRVRKTTESTKPSHQNQTGAGSKLFPRNR